MCATGRPEPTRPTDLDGEAPQRFFQFRPSTEV